MNCPRCGQPVAGLACPACTTLASREAIFQRQGLHLDDVRAGRLPFYAKRLSRRHPWHLMLFGDRAHGFCGVEIVQIGKHNQREIRYAELEKLQASCAACLDALHAVEEAHAIQEES